MDLVMLGGQVLTMDTARPRAEALAIRDGTIAAVGKTSEIRALIGPGTTVLDLAGRCVIPGFIDPHTHFSMTTFEPIAVDCRIPPLADKQAVLDAIAAAAAGAPPGRWIWGLGYSSRRGRTPSDLTRRELDAAAPHNPVCIIDSSVHALYANSAAMTLAAVSRATPNPDGGEIRKDEDGEPGGPLWERAMDRVYQISMASHMEVYGADAVADLVRQNSMRHVAYGITSVADAAVTPEAARMYRIADERGCLPIVIHQLRAGEGFFAAPELVARGELTTDDVSDRLRGGTMKMFMDPVFPRNAGVQVHPDGRRELLGRPYYEQEQADELAVSGARVGLQVAIHCLGTWAIDQGLNALERAIPESSRDDARHRIEHFSSPTRAQIARAAALGVTVVHQPSFLYTFGERAAVTHQEMGIDAAPTPMRTMLDEGVNVAASSDFPCAPLDPLLGIYSLVSRRTRNSADPVAPEESVTAMEALALYTIAGARAMKREHEVGSLEAGKRADLAVLSHDPTAVEPDFIPEVRVEQTYVEGERVYDHYRR
jgi:predicted amidohydrolase YtcJ